MKRTVAGFIGVILLAFGLILFYLEMQKDTPHNQHTTVIVGIMIVGALLIPLVPTLIADGAKQIIVVVAPFIPFVGGRRKEDQQLADAVKAAKNTGEGES